MGERIDAMRLMFLIQRVYRAAPMGLGHHHHTRAAAEGVIVAFEVLILGIIADIHDVDGNFSRFLRPAEDTFLPARKTFRERG